MKLYDNNGKSHEVEEVRRGTHIELRFDNEFYCTCENRTEVMDEIEDMMSCFGLSECEVAI